MQKKIVQTDKAPAAIGTYSQAVIAQDLLFTSGQIALKPGETTLCSTDFEGQAHQVFKNLTAVAQAAGTTWEHAVKLTVFVIDLAHFSILNTVMAEYVSPPFPARSAVQVSALPKDALIEIEAIFAVSCIKR